jgi:nitrite reductase (cytochrome c-552)
VLLSAVAAAGSAALAVNIMERKQEAKNPFFRVTELTDDTVDPAEWGQELPPAIRRLQAHGGHDAHALWRQRGRAPRAHRDGPALGGGPIAPGGGPAAEGILGPGYAFAVDFREERGHAYMLDDQTFTERQHVTKQPGTCIALPRLRLRALQAAGQWRRHRRASRR